MAAPAPSSTAGRILAVATELFYERGYHATTMRLIAEGVGIKAGSLYNHYKSKQALLMEIVYGTTTALYRGAAQRLEGLAAPQDRLRAFIKWHVEFHANERLAARIADEQLHALDPGNRRKALEIRDAHEKLLREILVAGMDEESWWVEDEAVVAFAIGTMCTHVDSWYQPKGRLRPEEIGTIFANFILAALTQGTALYSGKPGLGASETPVSATQ